MNLGAVQHSVGIVFEEPVYQLGGLFNQNVLPSKRFYYIYVLVLLNVQER